MTFLWSVLGFILVIGILVTIHEWGHYQVARWFNIKVLKFSIGFGKTIWSKQNGETEFQIAAIPLGGYVKFVDEAEGPVAPQDLDRAFNRQSVYKRFAVVAAGPLVNLIFAWLVFSVIYMIGITGLKPIFEHPTESTALYEAMPKTEQAWLVLEIDEKPVTTWRSVHESLLKALVDSQQTISLKVEGLNQSHETLLLKNVSLKDLDLNNQKQNWLKALGFNPVAISVPAVVGSISEGSPAELAGLQEGDIILSIDGIQIDDWRDLVKTVAAKPNQQVSFVLKRNGVELIKTVGLSQRKNSMGETVGQLGVGLKQSPEDMKPYLSTSQYGIIDSLILGYEKSLDLFDMSLVMLKKMLFGEVGVENLSGPVSIAQFSGQALQTGLISFLGLLGLLSLSLGILNLLPIPVLDGGHLLYYMIEMVKGSPVKESTMIIGQKIGLLLIIGLTILALTNDILRITDG
ncbi:RIP metalloprotease RseP [Thiomicrorhabdus sp. ZW0627]|uniref:RIP metalloprotease RseP n=1 Tax=Thiomicrorhabdus sp. ZW0627 TaxID=3039774 RepID=UPI0024366750|nr:RIP metalloprotease RseP [Thiomicrorhabdus sp. ZW0627]MDG6772998.1 RIP metalloprotease RseP [Thiomicrorhabdus sp. ZW0627]